MTRMSYAAFAAMPPAACIVVLVSRSIPRMGFAQTSPYAVCPPMREQGETGRARRFHRDILPATMRDSRQNLLHFSGALPNRWQGRRGVHRRRGAGCLTACFWMRLAKCRYATRPVEGAGKGSPRRRCSMCGSPLLQSEMCNRAFTGGSVCQLVFARQLPPPRA